jgi:hypothetical protein
MSITFLQLSKNLEGFAGYLEGPEHGNIMVQMASEALALNKMRVQEKGEGSNGEKYKPYSKKPMLANRSGMTQSAYSSIAGSKKKRQDLDWVTVKGHKLFELPNGYKQFRELHGRQTTFVDFTLSGRMWNNIRLVSDRSELNSGVAVIKATEELQKKKLAGNTERRGEILGLSKKEEERLSDIYSVWVEGALKKYKLA